MKIMRSKMKIAIRSLRKILMVKKKMFKKKIKKIKKRKREKEKKKRGDSDDIGAEVSDLEEDATYESRRICK